MTDPSALVGRWLRQRGELGGIDIVLEHLTAAELVAALTATPGAPTPRAIEPREARPATVGAAGTVIPPPITIPAVERFSEQLTPAERGAGATAPGATDAEIARIDGVAELRAVCLGCPRCRLSETRTRVVFGEGNPTAEVVVVGEAPGAEEDRSGRPFVGPAGQQLDLMLESIGLSRESVFICNVLKCRPPGNRNPLPEEIAACSPYLLRQLELIRPRAIFAVGAFAAQTLLATEVPISRLRGKVYAFRDIPVVPTYHPAALLRNPAWARPVWEDLQRLRSIVDPV